MGEFNIYIKERLFVYELENVARMFFRHARVLAERPRPLGVGAYVRLSRTKERVRAVVAVNGEILVRRFSREANDSECELELAKMLFGALSRLTGMKPPWGVMTGIRPAKYARTLLVRGSADEARRLFTQKYLVSQDKTELAFAVARVSAAVAAKVEPRDFSLYVSIPFCPSRCDYCTFVSKTVGRDTGLLEKYLDCLAQELEAAGRLARELRLRLKTVYVGGGTPSVLSASQLERLCADIARSFSLDELAEYTVEAGRPDTITRDKLEALKRAGVRRISVNPQTMDDRVLAGVGRKHTSQMTREAYTLARDVGFECINMDLIAGLPGDTPEGFARSLDELISLEPENITVHALTLKRASIINEQGADPANGVAHMLAYTSRALTAAAYSPYYMYKQKATVENLENCGWSKRGFEGLYNVLIMEELETIIAAGAGAVTKLVEQKTGHVERIFNYKYPLEYINGIDEVKKRKEGARGFYEG